jgi:hypothetical protein
MNRLLAMLSFFMADIFQPYNILSQYRTRHELNQYQYLIVLSCVVYLYCIIKCLDLAFTNISLELAKIFLSYLL